MLERQVCEITRGAKAKPFVFPSLDRDQGNAEERASSRDEEADLMLTSKVYGQTYLKSQRMF